MSDDDFPKRELTVEQQPNLRERLQHPDQELIEAIAEYLLVEYDDPVGRADLLAVLNTRHEFPSPARSGTDPFKPAR